MGDEKNTVAMKKWLANILLRLLLHSDEKYKNILFDSLFSATLRKKREFFKEKYNISKSFRFNGHFINFYGDGQIFCGNHSYLGDYSTIQADTGYKVHIGNNCALSHNVRIYTSTYVADQDFDVAEKRTTKGGDVIIEDGVWIGANVFINPGVVIGENAVIGANSVVTKSVARNTINGGVPCKLIRNKDL